MTVCESDSPSSPSIGDCAGSGPWSASAYRTRVSVTSGRSKSARNSTASPESSKSEREKPEAAAAEPVGSPKEPCASNGSALPVLVAASGAVLVPVGSLNDPSPASGSASPVWTTAVDLGSNAIPWTLVCPGGAVMPAELHASTIVLRPIDIIRRGTNEPQIAVGRDRDTRDGCLSCRGGDASRTPASTIVLRPIHVIGTGRRRARGRR